MYHLAVLCSGPSTGNFHERIRRDGGSQTSEKNMGDVQNHQNVSTREVKTNPKGYIMYNHCVWNLHGASIFLPQDVGKTPETSHFHPDPAPWGPWLPLGPLGTHHGSLAVHLSQLFTFLQDVLCRRNSVDGDKTGKTSGCCGLCPI